MSGSAHKDAELDAVTRVEGPAARVLVIDDDEIVLKAIVRAFGSTYELTAVSEGEAALKLLDADALWDVVLCDLMMPTVTGIEMHRTAEKCAPHLAERFVFMTGGALTVRHRQFMDEARVRVVHKPFDITEMGAVLSEVAAKARCAREV